MAVHINNMRDLEKALQPVLVKMVDQMADRVYQTLNYFLKDYYTGWTPSSYQRTMDFLYSAVKVDAKPCKGGAKASVYIDYESMKSYVNQTGNTVHPWGNKVLLAGL